METITEKLNRESTELMKVRRDFADLKKDEEKYLQDREVKAQALLTRIYKEIESAEATLGSVQDKTLRVLKGLGEKVDSLMEGLDSMLDRSGKTLEKSHGIIKKNEKTTEILRDAFNHVVEMTNKASLFERQLKIKEQDADRKDKKADEKLAEAKQLADWHKKGKRYVIKK